MEDEDWLAAEPPGDEPAPAHSRGVHQPVSPAPTEDDERPLPVSWALRITTVAAMVWVAIGGALVLVAGYQIGTDDAVAQAGWADFQLSLGLASIALGGVLFLAAACTRSLTTATWVLALGINAGVVVVGVVWLPPALVSLVPLALLVTPAAKDAAVSESRRRSARFSTYAPSAG